MKKTVPPIVQYMLKIYCEQSCSQFEVWVKDFGFLPEWQVTTAGTIKKNMEKRKRKMKTKQMGCQIKKGRSSLHLESINDVAGRGK